jgi:uncharacterized protein
MRAIVKRHPIVAYFVMTYLISWGGALLVAAPTVLSGHSLSQVTGLIMFPVMLLGPSISGITLTAMTSGRSGLSDLFARLGRWRVSGQWYATLLIPPTLVLTVLFGLRTLVSPVFTPHLYPLGIVYGIVPGFLEEIGWSGFVFPRLCARLGVLPASLVLGVLWGCWHLPVIDYLGAAYPHGAYWLPFALAFITAMTAMRVIIVWVYCHTGSVLLTQLLHASSTASLAALGPVPILPAQETLWYAVYAGLLWVTAAAIIAAGGTRLMPSHAERPVARLAMPKVG